MKLKVFIFMFLLLVLFSILFFQMNSKVNNLISSDEIKFKQEYEKLNSIKDKDGNNKYVNISIIDNNNIIYSNYKEIMEVINKGTGIIYLGFPECPWCRNAIPVLIDSAKESGESKIYYYNALSIRDIKSLDKDGNIITDKEGTKEYYKLVEALKDHLPIYKELKNDSIKRIYFPTVIFIKDGSIIGVHTSTVDTQTNPNKKLSKSQKEQLSSIYLNYIYKMQGIVCSDNTPC